MAAAGALFIGGQVSPVQGRANLLHNVSHCDRGVLPSFRGLLRSDRAWRLEEFYREEGCVLPGTRDFDRSAKSNIGLMPRVNNVPDGWRQGDDLLV